MSYVDRVNRAIDHIVRNIDQPLRLEEVAGVACFSKYHFHRVFAALTGETLNQFTRRVRLERALYLLCHRPHLSLTEVALECGFGSSSDFSRSFKRRYGVPPSAFDLETFRRHRRDQMIATLTPDDRHLLAGLPPGENPDGFAVELRELGARTVAYIRVHRPYEEGNVLAANERLVAWATERSLEGGQWLGYTWDLPDIVPLELCRYDVGLEVETRIDSGPEISWTTFAPMTVAETAISGPIELEQRALDWLYRTWLPSSGVLPAHQPGFEAWDGLPWAHGNEHFELRLQVPVERIR